jgi:hypothetical protein
LAAVVDEEFVRNSKILYSPVKAVFKRIDCLLQIESGADNVPRGVVDPDNEVNLLL